MKITKLFPCVLCIVLCSCNSTNNIKVNESINPSTLVVEPIENLKEDFVFGMDISSLLSQEKSGVSYYDRNGQESDLFEILSQEEIHDIRLRIWNDPYDENGHGYGGGNNDVESAIILGKRAAKHNMKVCIDFHYSDFWSDPKRQIVPKAWKGMSIEEKTNALYAFTYETLQSFIKEHIDISIVQIGNEINHGMAGETSLENIIQLVKAGSKAVRDINQEYNQNIQVALHYTNLKEKEKLNYILNELKLNQVNYDIIGLSYYPFWDVSIDEMKDTLRDLKNRFEKDIVILETSYCYTLEDGDDYTNSLSDTQDLVNGYPATVQGQANILRDIISAANEVGVKGIYYWEGAWIPVGSSYAHNLPIWEKHGSGWASSYAADYDPDDAGLYYGGCSWENQALFDFEGKPLESLYTWKTLKNNN